MNPVSKTEGSDSDESRGLCFAGTASIARKRPKDAR